MGEKKGEHVPEEENQKELLEYEEWGEIPGQLSEAESVSFLFPSASLSQTRIWLPGGGAPSGRRDRPGRALAALWKLLA